MWTGCGGPGCEGDVKEDQRRSSAVGADRKDPFQGSDRGDLDKRLGSEAQTKNGTRIRDSDMQSGCGDRYEPLHGIQTLVSETQFEAQERQQVQD